MEIRTLIIDDEPLAQNVIEQYALKIPNLKVSGKCNDAISAHKWLQQNKADLIFLDINMPKMSGISFLKNLKNPPLVIITTAYSEYALEGFELDAVDYLKKPFSFDRFCKAFFKAEELLYLRQKAVPNEVSGPEEKQFLFIKANKKTYKINIPDIQYIEGLGDYIQIFFANQKVISNLSMKGIMETLPSDKFFRIHKSYIISLDFMELIEGNSVIVNNKRLPIGNNYRQQFLDMVNRNI